MRDKSAIPTAEVARSIRDAFHRAGPCNCHTVAKLGEEELLVWLIGQGVLGYEDVGPGSMPIAMLSEVRRGRLPHGVSIELSRHVKTIAELTQWTYADLMSLTGFSTSAVKTVERELERYGLSLKDGNATRAPAKVLPKAPPLSNASPDEIRRTCSRSLIDMSVMIGRDSASVIKLATDIMAGKRMAGRIKRYGSDFCSQSRADEVLRVAGPLIALEESERDSKPAARRKAKAPVDNVVRLAATA